MKIVVTFNTGEQATIYGTTPLDFALAIAEAYNQGELEFQTKDSVEDAVREYNAKKVIS
jgi:hypothetical protein